MITNAQNKDLPEALQALLSIYKRRRDLQDAYPETDEAQYQPLINWAARAATNSQFRKDSDYPILSKYVAWYETNKGAEVRPKRENIVKEITAKSQYPYNHTLDMITKESDISEHLPTLYMLTTELKLRQVLELGVRYGTSTVALLEAISHIDGHLWSMDIADCRQAISRVKALGLDSYWTFMKGNDLDLGRDWNQMVDHIFIDSSHDYEHTLEELKLFEKFVNPGGIITLHDTRSHPGIIRAINDFLNITAVRWSFHHYFNNNGFAVLRKT